MIVHVFVGLIRKMIKVSFPSGIVKMLLCLIEENIVKVLPCLIQRIVYELLCLCGDSEQNICRIT
jgi:hypothetical protein